MSLATRIGVMNQGEIAMVGEPTEIYEFPNSRFVADFIGSANMVEGVVTEDEPDHVRIHSHELGTDIYVDHGVDCSPDQILWWAIRPEKDPTRVQAGRRPACRRRQHAQGLCRGHRLSGRHDRLPGPAAHSTMDPLMRVTKERHAPRRPDAITWDELFRAGAARPGRSAAHDSARELRRARSRSRLHAPLRATAGCAGRSSSAARVGRSCIAGRLWLTSSSSSRCSLVFKISLCQGGRRPAALSCRSYHRTSEARCS